MRNREITVTRTKLNSEEFHVPSHDLNGSTIRLLVGLPPKLDKAIVAAIASRKFPFGTKEDVIRWCVFEGVRNLESMGACISELPLVEILTIITRTEVGIKKFENFFSKLDRALIELTTSGYQEHSARRLVRAVQELVLCLPSSRDRSWFLSELRRRWGHLLIGPLCCTQDSQVGGRREKRLRGGESR